MDNNETFELLSKMYNEMQNMNTKLSTEMHCIEKKLTSLENTVTRIEENHSKKLDALFDGYKQNRESVNLLANSTLDLQSDINNLTIKTLKAENNIINFSKVLNTKTTR